MYLSLYCKGSKRVTQCLRVRGSWRPNRNCNILTPLLWPSSLCLSRSSNAQPEALGPTLLGDGFPYCILSASSLVPKLHRYIIVQHPLRFPSAPSAGCDFFFTLSHIVSQAVCIITDRNHTPTSYLGFVSQYLSQSCNGLLSPWIWDPYTRSWTNFYY